MEFVLRTHFVAFHELSHGNFMSQKNWLWKNKIPHSPQRICVSDLSIWNKGATILSRNL